MGPQNLKSVVRAIGAFATEVSDALPDAVAKALGHNMPPMNAENQANAHAASY
jgi:hypothetical protein